MKSKLIPADHDPDIIEVWFDGKLVGQVQPADGAGIRVLSRYQLEAKVLAKGSVPLVSRMTNVTLVKIG